MIASSVSSTSGASKNVFDYAYEAMVAAYRMSGMAVQDFIDDINDRNRAIDELRKYKRAASEVIASPVQGASQDPWSTAYGPNAATGGQPVYFFHNRQQYYIQRKPNQTITVYSVATGQKVNGSHGFTHPTVYFGNQTGIPTGYTRINGMPGTSSSQSVFVTTDTAGTAVVAYGPMIVTDVTDLNFETVNTFISDRISSYSSTNQLDLIKLQKSINDMNLLISMLTNMLKSVNDTNSTVARNI